MDAKQVPLRELLASVPADARLVIDDADGKGTRFIPVGRLCQEAAAALAEPVQERKPRHVSYVCPQCYWSLDERKPLTDEEIEQIADDIPVDDLSGPTTWHIKLARAIERAHGVGEKE